MIFYLFFSRDLPVEFKWMMRWEFKNWKSGGELRWWGWSARRLVERGLQRNLLFSIWQLMMSFFVISFVGKLVIKKYSVSFFECPEHIRRRLPDIPFSSPALAIFWGSQSESYPQRCTRRFTPPSCGPLTSGTNFRQPEP